MGKFSEAYDLLPPQGRQILDQIYEKYCCPPPFISPPEKDNDFKTNIGWSYKALYFDFMWSEESGFEWFCSDRNTGKYYGSGDVDVFDVTFTPEIHECLERYFSVEENIKRFALKEDKTN